MWALDRFANHNNSQTSLPSSRPYSPAPRRSNLGPGRPSLSTRESSLSLISPSGSHSNLPSTARLPPRTSSKTAPPPDVEDPLAALERVIGKRVTSVEFSDAGDLAERPRALEDAVVFDGLSLQEFAYHGASTQNTNIQVLAQTTSSIEECMSSSHTHFHSVC